MRKLTIERKKTFVASLMKINVYTPDENGLTLIRGIRSSKLGEVKNGQVLTFELDEGERDLLFCYCNEENGSESPSYRVPAGSEDVTVTIKPKLNPFRGNPIVIQK